MASGIPVIATKWGGPADYLDGSCGFLVEPSSRETMVQGFAAAMSNLIVEPRLRDVRATVLSPAESRERTIRFRVDARLCLDPAPEVAFDTILELSTGRYAVTPSGAPS